MRDCPSDTAARDYDPHEPCRHALNRAYEAAAERRSIKQILQLRPDGVYMVLQVLAVDQLPDGLRIVVR